MPRNRSDQDIIDHRREVVAMLRLHGLTIRGIVEELPKYDIINEKRGKPWSRRPVHDDLLALAKEWQEAAAVHTDELKGSILAEIREVRRVAWEGKELKVVLAALEDERKLLGMDAPTRSELSGPNGGPIEENINVSDIREKLVDRVNRIAAAGEAGAIHSEPG